MVGVSYAYASTCTWVLIPPTLSRRDFSDAYCALCVVHAHKGYFTSLCSRDRCAMCSRLALALALTILILMRVKGEALRLKWWSVGSVGCGAGPPRRIGRREGGVVGSGRSRR